MNVKLITHENLAADRMQCDAAVLQEQAEQANNNRIMSEEEKQRVNIELSELDQILATIKVNSGVRIS